MPPNARYCGHFNIGTDQEEGCSPSPTCKCPNVSSSFFFTSSPANSSGTESAMSLGSDEVFQVLFVLLNIIGIAVSNRLFAGIVDIVISREAYNQSNTKQCVINANIVNSQSYGCGHCGNHIMLFQGLEWVKCVQIWLNFLSLFFERFPELPQVKFLLAGFVQSKPDGRKTAIGEVR